MPFICDPPIIWILQVNLEVLSLTYYDIVQELWLNCSCAFRFEAPELVMKMNITSLSSTDTL
jgi:hypothetical protein